MDDSLPFLDEHVRTLDVPPDAAWRALVATMEDLFAAGAARGYARLVACEPMHARGPFPAVGSAVPGFRVARAQPPRELALEGRHRFARYHLTFRLDAIDDGARTRIRAETRAAFPGAAGRAYRLVVIGSGGHALAVKRWLAVVAREAARRQRDS